MKKIVSLFVLIFVLSSFVLVDLVQAAEKLRLNVSKGSATVGKGSSTTLETSNQVKESSNKIAAEKKIKNIRAYFGHMVRKIQAAIDRESKLADRIESRLNKFEAAGKNVSAQKAKLTDARLSIQDAQRFLDGAKAKIENVLKSDNMQQAFKDVRSLIKSAVEKIKLAHKKLVEVVVSLKGMRIEKSPIPLMSPIPTQSAL